MVLNRVLQQIDLDMSYFVSYMLQPMKGMFVLDTVHTQDIWLVEDTSLLDSEHEGMVDIHLQILRIFQVDLVVMTMDPNGWILDCVASMSLVNK